MGMRRLAARAWVSAATKNGVAPSGDVGKPAQAREGRGDVAVRQLQVRVAPCGHRAGSFSSNHASSRSMVQHGAILGHTGLANGQQQPGVRGSHEWRSSDKRAMGGMLGRSSSLNGKLAWLFSGTALLQPTSRGSGSRDGLEDKRGSSPRVLPESPVRREARSPRALQPIASECSVEHHHPVSAPEQAQDTQAGTCPSASSLRAPALPDALTPPVPGTTAPASGRRARMQSRVSQPSHASRRTAADPVSEAVFRDGIAAVLAAARAALAPGPSWPSTPAQGDAPRGGPPSAAQRAPPPEAGASQCSSHVDLPTHAQQPDSLRGQCRPSAFLDEARFRAADAIEAAERSMAARCGANWRRTTASTHDAIGKHHAPTPAALPGHQAAYAHERAADQGACSAPTVPTDGKRLHGASDEGMSKTEAQPAGSLPPLATAQEGLPAIGSAGSGMTRTPTARQDDRDATAATHSNRFAPDKHDSRDDSRPATSKTRSEQGPVPPVFQVDAAAIAAMARSLQAATGMRRETALHAARAALAKSSAEISSAQQGASRRVAGRAARAVARSSAFPRWQRPVEPGWDWARAGFGVGGTDFAAAQAEAARERRAALISERGDGATAGAEPGRRMAEPSPRAMAAKRRAIGAGWESRWRDFLEAFGPLAPSVRSMEVADVPTIGPKPRSARLSKLQWEDLGLTVSTPHADRKAAVRRAAMAYHPDRFQRTFHKSLGAATVEQRSAVVSVAVAVTQAVNALAATLE